MAEHEHGHARADLRAAIEIFARLDAAETEALLTSWNVHNVAASPSGHDRGHGE